MKSSIHCSKWHALITFGATDLLLPFNIGHVDTKSELNTTKLLQCYLTVSLTANAASSFLAYRCFDNTKNVCHTFHLHGRPCILHSCHNDTLGGISPFGRLFKLSMDLLRSFGYAPSMASMALLTSINPLAISEFGVVLPTNALKRLEEWR
jgi:hypothetical protein